MSGNQWGQALVLSSFGESHGPALGGMLDGVPSGISLSEADIQPWLDRRRPGQSKYTTQRQEEDKIIILSGIFEGKTTGMPIGFTIANQDQRSKDYSEIAEKFRPGHADYSWWRKYGVRDYRGGGRSSARETAVRVAAGAIAYKILQSLIAKPVSIRGALIQIGDLQIDRSQWDWAQIGRNPFFSPDAAIVPAWKAYLEAIRKEGDSVGAVIELVAENIPVGLGEPVFHRLDADIAQALMGINAVKGVEIGDGFAAAFAKGSDFADEILPAMQEGGEPNFTSNHAGGILGGVSSGQPIVVRFAVKPTSSILQPRRTIDIHGKATHIITKGRHDPCVGIRAVPVGEAMLALVLADHLLRQRAQSGKIGPTL